LELLTQGSTLAFGGLEALLEPLDVFLGVMEAVSGLRICIA
jgi:hypothetical protein